jgi:hypothetical protein
MKLLVITMPDGSQWGVPVDIIANNRALHYAHEFDGNLQRSLDEDTRPLFESDDYAIEDWAANNMNWSDFDGCHYKIKDADPPDFQEAWVNGGKAVIDWSSDEKS